MNKQEIERLWKIATNDPNHDSNWHDPVVVKFAELVERAARADERKHIEDICDELSNKYEEMTPPMHAWANIVDEVNATITSRRQNI